jgi:hypothetical protein
MERAPVSAQGTSTMYQMGGMATRWIVSFRRLPQTNRISPAPE